MMSLYSDVFIYFITFVKTEYSWIVSWLFLYLFYLFKLNKSHCGTNPMNPPRFGGECRWRMVKDQHRFVFLTCWHSSTYIKSCGRLLWAASDEMKWLAPRKCVQHSVMHIWSCLHMRRWLIYRWAVEIFRNDCSTGSKTSTYSGGENSMCTLLCWQV